MTTGNELVTTIEGSGLEQSTANQLKTAFLPFFEKASKWKKTADALVVTDASQKDLMKTAREGRLQLKAIRVEADKKRKALKEDSLRYGKAVQGVYNVIEYLIAPIEEHLEKQEKFAEIQAANLRASLKAQRTEELHPYAAYVPFGVDLGGLEEDEYLKFYMGCKLQHEAALEQAALAEQARLQKIEDDRIERERVKAENERLKAEAEEQSKKMEAERKEREAAEAKAKAERDAIEAKAKAEAEKARKEREEVEAKLNAERARAEKEKAVAEAKLKAKLDKEKSDAAKAKKEAAKAARAPDKEKLEALVVMLASVVYPEVSSEEARRVVDKAVVGVTMVIKNIQLDVSEL